MKQLIEQLKSLIEDANNTTDRLVGTNDRSTYEQYRGRRQAYQKILRVVEAMDTEPIQNEPSLVVRIVKLLESNTERTERQQFLSNCCRGRFFQAAETLMLVNELVTEFVRTQATTKEPSVGIVEQLEKRIEETRILHDISLGELRAEHWGQIKAFREAISLIQQAGRAIRPDTTKPIDLAKIITERIAVLESAYINYDREIAELKLIADLLKQHPYHKSMLQQRLQALCDGAKTVLNPELKKEYKYRIAEVSFLLDATE